MHRIARTIPALIVAAICTSTGPAARCADCVPVGVARIDITPDYPVRLTGYASRTTESEGVAQRIWAKAMAIGADAGDGPLVLVSVENCGVPGPMVDRIAARLSSVAGLKRERIVVCSTHIHTGPWLEGFLPMHSLEPLPKEHVRHIETYSHELPGKIEQVVLGALDARKPCRLGFAQGTVRFAMNRRPVKNGRCPGIGINPQGTVDHSLPLLCVRDAQGRTVAVLLNYACHCTTCTGTDNRVHGDWAGVAQQMIEAEHPGTMALVSLGCGADANPEPRGKMEMTQAHGREVAAEVKRLLAGKLQPVSPPLSARMTRMELPFGKLPTRDEFEQRLAAGRRPGAKWIDTYRAGHAAAMLAQLDRGTLPKHVDYSVTVWSFGTDLAMVFLPGEVVADYALRLKRELDGRRLWVTAYTNGVPCYIPTRRMFAEGGYEPDSSMVGYGLPGPLDESVEQRVIAAAKSLVPAAFKSATKPQAAAKAAVKPAVKPAAKAKTSPPPWKAGVATVKITPRQPMWMAGYASRNKPSEGVAQDLFAKALALEDPSGARVVMVTLDLIGVPRSSRDWVDAEVQKKYGLQRSQLLLNASHTHSGPEIRGEKLQDHANESLGEQYTVDLEHKLVDLVGRALASMAPANLDYLHARCGFAMNRRRPTDQGFTNAPNAEGPVDHDVPVLRVTDVAGGVRAVMFGYACHNTCLGLYKFCGDYAGYAQEYFEKDKPGVVAMFLMGCGGDQNPYPRRTEELCQRHGRTLATAAEAALETVPRRLSGPLRTAWAEVTLDFAPPPSKAELEKIAATNKRPAAGHARRLLEELARTGRVRSTYPFPVQVIRFGDQLTLVALAGETVVDYSLRIKRELAGPAVWVAGYSNDVFGYLPSRRVLKEGGYEAADAALWGSLPGAFTETLEDRIVAKVRELTR